MNQISNDPPNTRIFEGLNCYVYTRIPVLQQRSLYECLING